MYVAVYCSLCSLVVLRLCGISYFFEKQSCAEAWSYLYESAETTRRNLAVVESARFESLGEWGSRPFKKMYSWVIPHFTTQVHPPSICTLPRAGLRYTIYPSLIGSSLLRGSGSTQTDTTKLPRDQRIHRKGPRDVSICATYDRYISIFWAYCKESPTGACKWTLSKSKNLVASSFTHMYA